MKIYYLNFKPDADVNYLHLFSLYDLADYNPATKAYDTINYTSIPKLAALLPYSAQTLDRLLKNDEYKKFLSIDKTNKVITLYSSVISGSNNNCFVRLTEKEVAYLRKVLASGVPNHILSGITNHFLPENWEPINEFLDCQQPRLANCLFLCCHRLNSLNLAGLH